MWGIDKRWKHLSAKLARRWIFHIRVVVDYDVDRLQVYVSKYTQLSSTNYPTACTFNLYLHLFYFQYDMKRTKGTMEKRRAAQARKGIPFLHTPSSPSSLERSCWWLLVWFGVAFDFNSSLSEQLNQLQSCWWLLVWCSPLPIPNREVKPGSADDTWFKPGKVGSRHNY